MAERLVVVGGDAGGMSAASQARRRRGPDDLEIVAFERGRYTSYSACGIPYFVGGLVDEVDDLIARDPATFRSRFDIDVRLRTEVVGIDVAARTVTSRELDGGKETTEGFDQLVIATGATPFRPDLPGAGAEGIHGVQVLQDGLDLRELVGGGEVRRAVVVGGGYIGLEMAEALHLRGVEVTLVDRGAQPMSTLDPDMGELVGDALRDLGITVRSGEEVNGFEERSGRVAAVVTSEATIETDLVVLGMGVTPNSTLARAAGLTIGVTGGVVVDVRQRASAEGVWAAGDCTELYHRVSRRPVAIALGTHANKQGRVAGINIGGGYATFAGVVGTAVSKICACEVARTGLREVDAGRAGFQYVTATVDSTTRAGYYPGAAPIRTKIIAERRTGRLLGAQIVGREGAAKRIDVLATALWNDMTVEEISGMDLSYAPPFSPVWDPVLIAARKAAEAVDAGDDR